MKMPSVHHEISMKMPWVTFPKSDFGITVLIGVSQFQPTALHGAREQEHGRQQAEPRPVQALHEAGDHRDLPMVHGVVWFL